MDVSAFADDTGSCMPGNYLLPFDPRCRPYYAAT